MKLTITFSAILSLCRFGDHVLLFSGSTAMILVFQASCSQISCYFSSPHRLTHPKPGNLFDERTKRGWPKPYGFFLGFLTTLLLRISVYLSLFFFVDKINWNCTKTLNIPFGGSRTRIKKMKNAMIYWPQGQWVGLGLVTALRFTRALSNGPDVQKRKNDCGQTIHV